MEKMGREAKLRTTWTSPDAAYAEAIARFVSAVLSPQSGAAFLGDLVPACRPPWVSGAVNGLAQLALKVFASSVPASSQGCERWGFTLVEPYNRCPAHLESRGAL